MRSVYYTGAKNAIAQCKKAAEGIAMKKGDCALIAVLAAAALLPLGLLKEPSGAV